LRAFVVDRMVRYLFLFPLGIQGLWAFVGHVVFPERSAEAIGWAPSPFKYEVGAANLGLGLASIYAAFRGFEARVAAGIVAACFLIGAGIVHIRDILATLAPGNAGPILVTDFLTPIVVLALASGKPTQIADDARTGGRARKCPQGDARISRRSRPTRQVIIQWLAKTSVVPSFLISSTS
ncbi:MAG TPA: DUF6790 family protein, partial [Methyloceanibacter sp.]|nr:DUF6790 family protein [Methyloceanibacter sp.]